MSPKILAVDDEAKNLQLIKGFLASTGHEIITACDGVEAWKILEECHDTIDVILLDRMMPRMNGMELMEKIKTREGMKHIPVIMQTAAAERNEVEEGINAGVYYYLTKPYSPTMLISIVNAALEDYRMRKALWQEIHKHKKMLGLINSSHFTFTTLEEASDLTTFLAQFFPDPERVAMGVMELLINAVEHGNLGITYEEKSALNQEGRWKEEIERRLSLPENKDKCVEVMYKKTDTHITLIVKDVGEGFDWKKYMHIDPDRAVDTHGRGIAMANLFSFDSVEYQGKGNEVVCTINLKADGSQVAA